MIELDRWHYRLHRVTGAMALHWRKATAADLAAWAHELSAITVEMERAATASGPCGQPDRAAPPDSNAPRAGHENR
jgi:hypothetical protein